MADSFDAYHKWLGIAPKDQPPNHYRLLAIEPFESDPDVIEAAADQRMSHVRTYQTGQNSALSQQILNELSSAKLCLLDPRKKADYDRQLRLPLAQTEQAGAGAPPATSARPSRPLKQARPLPAQEAPPLIVSDVTSSSSAVRRRRRPPLWRQPAMLGGVGALVILGLAAYFVATRVSTNADGNSRNDKQATQAMSDAASPGHKRALANGASGFTTKRDNTVAAEPKSDPDREVAEEVLRREGKVGLLASDGTRVEVDDIASLPTADFKVLDAQIVHAEAGNVADLTFLAKATRLESLSLWDSRVTSQALSGIRGHASLKQLNLENTGLASGAIKRALPLPQLEVLLLAGCQITGEDLAELAESKNLRMLGLQAAPLADDDMERFAQFPHLRDLILYAVPIGDDGLALLAKSAPRLESLVISATKVTNEGLRHLVGLKSLKQLDIAGNPQITGDGLRRLKELPQLEWLKLDHTGINDDSLTAFDELPNLKELLLSGNSVTNAGIDHLKSLTSLVQLTLVDTRVTADGIVKLQKALPQCKIVSNAVASAEPPEMIDDRPSVSTDTDRSALSNEADRRDEPRPPLPAGEELTKAKDLVIETYAKELAGDDKVAAINVLMAAARDSGGDKIALAALLITASEVGAKAGEFSAAFGALDELGRAFDFDAMQAKVEMLEEASKAVRSNDQRIVVVNRALELLDEASAAERFDLAERAAKAGQTAVGRLKDAELRKELASRRKDLEKQRKLYETREKELAEARRTLEQKPDDESANETLGTYLCFDRNNWAAGLKHLSKAASQPLRESATADLKGASDSESQMTIGDGWWDLAETAKHRNQLGFRSRAAFWYSKALPELTGLAKSKVEKRLKDADEALEIAYRQEENGGGKHRATILLAPGVPLVLVRIPASADGKVKSFWLGQTEVTEAQWAAVVADGTRPSSLPKGDVNIADVNGFLGRINTLNARLVVRLPRPNEAELAIGDMSQYGLDTVWFSENSGNNVHDVGTRRPNALGLYDIIGNAWEWCEGGQIYGAAFFDTRDGLGVRLHTPADGDNRRVRDVGFRIAADVRGRAG